MFRIFLVVFISIMMMNSSVADTEKISCSKSERKKHSFAGCLAVSGLSCGAGVGLLGSDKTLVRFAQRVSCRQLVNHYKSQNLTARDLDLRNIATGSRMAGDAIGEIGGIFGWGGKILAEGFAGLADHQVFKNCRERFEDICYRNYLASRNMNADRVIEQERKAKREEKRRAQDLKFRRLSVYQENQGDILSGDISGNKRYLAISMMINRRRGDYRLEIWDTKRKKRIARRSASQYAKTNVKFISNSAVIFNPGMQIWNFRTGRVTSLPSATGCGKGPGAMMSHNRISAKTGQRYVASICGHRERIIKVWDISRNRLKCSFRNDGEVGGVAISPNNRYLITGGNDYVPLVRWDIRRCQKDKVYKKHQESAINITFSPDGSRFITDGFRGFVVYDTATGEKLLRSRDGIHQAHFLNNDTLMVAIGNRVMTYSISKRRKIKYEYAGKKRPNTIILSSDKRKMFMGHGLGGELVEWNMKWANR